MPISVMIHDMLTAYKYGWKTSYYQNTYDFKGEEEDLQPAGIDTEQVVEKHYVNGEAKVNGEHINDEAKVNGEHTVEEQLADLEDGECEACTI